jgi:hypothetical protein
MPRPNCNPNTPEPITEDTRWCPFRSEGWLHRRESYPALLAHVRTRHRGRWPRSDREGLSQTHPWPDASLSYDLSALTIDALVDLWTHLEADALTAYTAGLRVPPPTP